MASGIGGVETSAARPLGTVILEAGRSIEALTRKLDMALIGRDAGRHRVLIACPHGEQAALAGSLPDRFRPLPMTAPQAWPEALPVDTERVAFLPAESAFTPPLWDSVPADGILLRPWPVPMYAEIELPLLPLSSCCSRRPCRPRIGPWPASSSRNRRP